MTIITIHPLNLSLHHQQECTDCQTNFYSKQYTVFLYSSFLEPYTAQSGRVVDLKTDRKIGRTLELLVWGKCIFFSKLWREWKKSDCWVFTLVVRTSDDFTILFCKRRERKCESSRDTILNRFPVHAARSLVVCFNFFLLNLIWIDIIVTCLNVV